MIWDILQESSFNSYFSEESLPTLTPETLLLDENIITEFKNLNPNLIQQQCFVSNSVENNYDLFLSRLIEYTIKLPLETDSEDRIRKLPYVSSEVLAIDNETVYKAFFDWDKDYFRQLIGLFDSPAKDNEILMGYFVKIVQNLYKCQKKKVPLSQAKTAQKIYAFRQTFYNNLDKESVGTVFRLFLVLLQTEDGFMIDHRKQVATKLVQNFVNGSELIKNVCKNVLVEVISKFQTFSSGDQLLNHILESEVLVKVFDIKESQSVDEFLIGFMTKALQKICTSGDQTKSLMQVPPPHKQGIKNYINAKKSILQTSSTSSFNNQAKKQVYRLNKGVSYLLCLIKLSLENEIAGFLEQTDFQALFRLLATHPSNDIIKVKIFQIFALIYTKKDTAAQEQFGKHFCSEAIKLFHHEKSMYGYFLYQLWKSIGKKLTKQNFQSKDEAKWAELIKYFDLLQSYEKQAQKVVDRYSNRTKVLKLVVDEEETTSLLSLGQATDKKPENKPKNSEGIEKQQSNEETVETIKQVAVTNQAPKKKKDDLFSFDFFDSSNVSSKTQTKQETKIKTDPFAAFDMFAPKSAKKQDESKKEEKKASFNDFTSFF